jgi:hypothetical protein
MGLETQIETKVSKYARSKGCLSYKFSSPANRGVPDRIFILPNGVVLFMELKAPGKIPTALQLKHAENIRANKGLWCWADNLEDAKSYLNLHL